ncbi:MAG: photoactive yellow protein [Leptospiraceae bacterium]|nr:photoactive yellow protein [Leptospiraceae bacterium]MCP5502072.1 photoactive yellow protein [Leptospiraceae bacterium]
MRFLDEDRLKSIVVMPRSEIDRLDIGVVKVDDKGQILLYNRYESVKAKVSPQEAEGKNFFTEVAPCTNNGIFKGSFSNGVQERNLDLIFPYTFTYKMKPTSVIIHLYRDNPSSSNWIFVNWK